MKKRFEWVKAEGVVTCCRILVDTETGVQYLYIDGTPTGGVTVLVGPDGKPLLHPDYVKDDLFKDGGFDDEFEFK